MVNLVQEVNKIYVSTPDQEEEIKALKLIVLKRVNVLYVLTLDNEQWYNKAIERDSLNKDLKDTSYKLYWLTSEEFSLLYRVLQYIEYTNFKDSFEK